jgi:hypothetical protein
LFRLERYFPLARTIEWKGVWVWKSGRPMESSVCAVCSVQCPVSSVHLSLVRGCPLNSTRPLAIRTSEAYGLSFPLLESAVWMLRGLWPLQAAHCTLQTVDFRGHGGCDPVCRISREPWSGQLLASTASVKSRPDLQSSNLGPDAS